MGHFFGITGSSTHLWLWNGCRQVGMDRSSPSVSAGMNRKAGTTWKQDDIPNFSSSTAELCPSIPTFKVKFSQQIPHQDLALRNILGHTGIDFCDAAAP